MIKATINIVKDEVEGEGEARALALEFLRKVSHATKNKVAMAKMKELLAAAAKEKLKDHEEEEDECAPRMHAICT